MSLKKLVALRPDQCEANRPGDSPDTAQPDATRIPSGTEKARQDRFERPVKIDPRIREHIHSGDEIVFMSAMDQYKRENHRFFPTWSEVLEVVNALGYRKVAKSAPIPGSATTIPPKETP